MILESDSSEADPNMSNPDPKPTATSGGAPPSSAEPPITSQELTLSYLCENPKSLTLTLENSNPIERDFLHLKREVPAEAEGREKKPKIESLNLSLSLTASPPPPPPPPPVAAAASARTANSDDFAPSLSYSQSVPFSHNPSCSLTRCSTENFSMSKENDQIWCAGEGTNGSVHSRFKPVGDGNTITFANPNPNGGENGISFFPSDLPARMGKVAVGENGRGVVSASVESGKMGASMLRRPDRVLREIVSESVSHMAQVVLDFPKESVDALKECLRNLMDAPERKEEFMGLQRRLERRSDLTMETLSRAAKPQLDILVATKTGIVGYLSGKTRVSSKELVEIFLMMRCKNLRCKSELPVDDCDCKFCAGEKGFCSACMCPICLKFDCASNTCSWVGCDGCSHWCHALCGLEKNIIRPGPNQKVQNGMTEMQFMCPGCNHASEMFGFVKEVFTCCAKDWGLETLMKELDCVKNIFQVSEDFEGKELEKKAKEMLTKLSKNQISPADACNGMLHFFKYGVSDLSVTGSSSKNILATQPSLLADIPPLPQQKPITVPPKSTFNLTKPSTSILETKIVDILKPERKSEAKPKAVLISKEPNFGLPQPMEDDRGFQSLETLVRFKEAEAKLFQRLADDACREVDGYRRIARAKMEKLEEEYATKIARLRLPEAEERRRKKLEELKLLENSHCDYQNMKVRMQGEIAGLLQRMEATKKQRV
ncbi:protein OBERON 3-like [Iris pallida]|uniref:OBERON-like protein n=1 Tax=Iris pallida TaxID=29817 RepID=A0AAX6I4V4_IRIPA|nr:protein OBERON 3-like [Iris pallida]KAJ6848340.1 protein OBERON 3-like [Iris pallida]